MTHVLIIGKNGQLGRHLCQLTQDWPNVTAWSREDCDLSDVEEIQTKLKETSPDIIINASAYTDTKLAETEIELALKVNAYAPAEMAKFSKKTGALFIHVSTDYVFDGTRRKPYIESDTINPLSSYGKSKAEGERLIKEIAGKELKSVAIIRTSWVFSEFGNNFLKTMLHLSQKQEQLQVVNDQYGAPTYSGHLAQIIKIVVEQFKQGKDVSGLFHYSDKSACSWFDFASEIIEQAKELGFSVVTKEINPVPASTWPSIVERPAFGVLSSEKLCQIIDFPAFLWKNGVTSALKNLTKESH